MNKTMQASQVSADKGGSFKGTLSKLEDFARNVQDDIMFSKREVQMLRQEKEQLENVLSHKSTEVRKTLQIEANRVEDDLKRNLATQKIENVKLQNQISGIKQEKTQLQQNLIGLQRRISEIELAIGGDQANATME